MPTAELHQSIPGVTTDATYERQLPRIDRALKAGKDAKTPEEKSKAVARKLVEIKKVWFDAQRWYINECVETGAMLHGSQYGYLSKYENRWVAIPEVKNPHEIRLVANQEKPIADQATAILTAEQPHFDCGPEQGDVKDAATADAGREFTRQTWEYHRLDGKFVATARSAYCFGTAYLRILWDRTAGQPVVVGMEGGEPQGVDENGAVQFSPMTPKIDSAGDHRFDVLQREQCAFDPSSTNETDGIGFMVQEKLSSAVLMEMYPDTYKFPNDSREGGNAEFREERMERASSMTDEGGNYGNRDSGDPEDQPVVVTTFWMRKRPKYPLGRVFVFTDDGQMLEERDNECYPTWDEQQKGELWPNFHWPVFALYCDTRERSPLGRGRLVDLHHLQKALNGSLSKAVQHAAIIANAKVMLPKGFDVEWTDQMGEVIRYGRLHQPNSIGYVQPPQMPAEYLTIVQVSRDLMQNIAGVNDPTMGTASSADQSGRAIEGLQQRDYVRLDSIKAELYRKWALAMTYALFLFRRNATAPRKLQIVGENGKTSIEFFDQSSLAAGTQITVFNNQAIPSDPTRRMLWCMNFMTTYAQAKDEQSRQMLLRLMGKREFLPFLEKLDPHRTAAERMVRQLVLGQEPMAEPWHNPLVFKVEFEQFLLSEQYQSFAQQNPPIAAYCVALWQWYTLQATPQAPPAPAPGADSGAPMGQPAAGPQPEPAPAMAA